VFAELFYSFECLLFDDNSRVSDVVSLNVAVVESMFEVKTHLLFCCWIVQTSASGATICGLNFNNSSSSASNLPSRVSMPVADASKCLTLLVGSSDP